MGYRIGFLCVQTAHDGVVIYYEVVEDGIDINFGLIFIGADNRLMLRIFSEKLLQVYLIIVITNDFIVIYYFIITYITIIII